MSLEEAIKNVTDRLLSSSKEELEKKLDSHQENPFLDLFLFESQLEKESQNNG